MPNKDAFTISGFAKFARTSRDTLLYYDKIKLLKPAARGKSGYRFYSISQAATVNIIRTCQQLGFSLEEIKELIERRTPAVMEELLAQQILRIDEIINKWARARKLLSTLQRMIHSARVADTAAIVVEPLPMAAIVLGDINDYSQGRDDHDALLDFYIACSRNYPDMDLNYPVWGIISAQRIRNRDFGWPDRYYFYNPDGFDCRPAGLYAIGYARGDYGEADALYIRMMAYIDANGLEACGPAYEEYPLNEITVSDPADYLIRVIITVRRKNLRPRKIPTASSV